MKKYCFSLLIASVATFSLLTYSCSKDVIEPVITGSAAVQKTTPNIKWHTFAEGSMVNGYNGALMVATDKAMAHKYIVIVHPDSASVGMILYTDPTAEVFRTRLQCASSQAKQPEIFITNDEDAFKAWHAKKVDDGYIVISFIDDEGFYHAYAYTVTEWNELNNPGPNPDPDPGVGNGGE